MIKGWLASEQCGLALYTATTISASAIAI